MLKVGITGGIATGKSFVCTIFKYLGVPVYNADLEAKLIIENNPALKKRLISRFGTQTYDQHGHYNTKYISSIVFNDSVAKKELNDLIHPLVLQHSFDWYQACDEAGSAYALKESALLIESKNHIRLDKMIVVDAPLEIRIERLMHRDDISREISLKKINSQMPQEEKLKYADFTILNDGQNPIIPQVYKIHHELIRLSEVPL
ncbi:MAG: dephospho-CoA kinase [Saprospiraceae bacterium]|nr:dephospho-CoA kinase [Saprospiraceae bacterium]